MEEKLELNKEHEYKIDDLVSVKLSDFTVAQIATVSHIFVPYSSINKAKMYEMNSVHEVGDISIINNTTGKWYEVTLLHKADRVKDRYICKPENMTPVVSVQMELEMWLRGLLEK